jgi:hypothetical protein
VEVPASSLLKLKKAHETTRVRFFVIDGASQFTILPPTNAAIAKKILHDDASGACKIAFTDQELSALFAAKAK